MSPAPMMATLCIAALYYGDRQPTCRLRCDVPPHVRTRQHPWPHISNSKVAVVTGGSRGIGLAITAALLEEGASVAISGLSQEHLDSARETLPPHADRLEIVRADVRTRADVDRLIGAAVSRFGGVDILVNNAGIGAFANVADMSDDDWNRVLETNLTGVFYCCNAAIPQLRTRGGGWIINISSLAGKNAFVGGAAYCASKAGLNAFSEALMQEVRHDGIRVSYVMPGSVATEFSRGGSASGTDWKLASEDVAQVVMDLLAHPDRSLPEPRGAPAVAASEEVSGSARSRPASSAVQPRARSMLRSRSGARCAPAFDAGRDRRPTAAIAPRRPRALRPPGGPPRAACGRPDAPRVRARRRCDRRDRG